MTGEMAQSEVIRETYPGLFALRDALKRRGIASVPRAFDHYAGPYLAVQDIGRVWYSQDEGERELFVIDNGTAPAFGGTFQTDGASYVMPATEKSLTAGIYTVRQAAKCIAQIVERAR